MCIRDRLYIAAENGHTDIVKLLLDSKAGVNARITGTGETPLYAAAQNGHTDTVKLLLDHKADVNACCNDDGATPLWAAVKFGHTEVEKVLLRGVHGNGNPMGMGFPWESHGNGNYI